MQNEDRTIVAKRFVRVNLKRRKMTCAFFFPHAIRAGQCQMRTKNKIILLNLFLVVVCELAHMPHKVARCKVVEEQPPRPQDDRVEPQRHEQRCHPHEPMARPLVPVKHGLERERDQEEAQVREQARHERELPAPRLDGFQVPAVQRWEKGKGTLSCRNVALGLAYRA